jgi:hypothetical protein
MQIQSLFLCNLSIPLVSKDILSTYPIRSHPKNSQKKHVYEDRIRKPGQAKGLFWVIQYIIRKRLSSGPANMQSTAMTLTVFPVFGFTGDSGPLITPMARSACRDVDR